MSRVVCIFLLVALPIVFSLLIDTQRCLNDGSMCGITQVNITPCKYKKNMCYLGKGQKHEIKFNFTPEFTTSELQTSVFWAYGLADVPFQAMEPDACKLTSCPTEAGKEQEYTYSLYVQKKYPPGTYPLKWKVFDGGNSTNMCCFQTTINIPKR